MPIKGGGPILLTVLNHYDISFQFYTNSWIGSTSLSIRAKVMPLATELEQKLGMSRVAATAASVPPDKAAAAAVTTRLSNREPPPGPSLAKNELEKLENLVFHKNHFFENLNGIGEVWRCPG